MTKPETCVTCDKTFEREQESTDDSLNYHDIYCDECWNEMSQNEL